jgi:preprotein translocase subunit SecE
MEEVKTGKISTLWRQLVAFLHDVRIEITKVTWPSWEELKGQTLVVIIAVLMIAAFIGAVDLVLSNTIKFLVTRLT